MLLVLSGGDAVIDTLFVEKFFIAESFTQTEKGRESIGYCIWARFEKDSEEIIMGPYETKDEASARFQELLKDMEESYPYYE